MYSDSDPHYKDAERLEETGKRGKMKQLTTAEIIAKYGQPGDTGNLGTIAVPYPMVLAWDRHIVVNRITCHRMVAERLIKIFAAIKDHYGLEKIQELGIDLYGGCYNNRPMRGGTEPSRHAFGVAIDLDPGRNMLHEDHTTARFARPEYSPMIDIFENYGFLSLGREKDFDWMHFETSI